MDDKVQKLLQRAINENLSPDRVSYIMQFNGYDQSAIDAALDELSKKKRPVLFQKQYDSSDTPSPSQQVGPPRPSEEEAPVPAPADVNLGEPLTFDQGTGGLTSVADEKEVEVSVSDWWGDKWNGLVEGVSDFMYHFDKETGNTKEQIAEFVELSKEKYPELYNTYQQNLQSEDLLNLGYDQERIKREAAQQAYVDFWQTNPDIENEVVPFIRERRRQQDVEETGVKIDEAVTKELDSRFLSGAVKGLAGSIPAMVTAGATMGGSFMTTSYYAADEDLKRTFAENPDLEMTRGQQEAYKLTVAGVEGILEKIGLSGALKGTSMAKSVLVKKVFSRLAGMGEDVSSEAFERIVKQEAKGLKGYLKNTAQGTLSEAETGALQQLSVDLINETVNGLSGQEIFTPKSAMTIIQDAIYAGAQEAVGGGIISGSVGAFSRDIATQEDFDAAEEFIGRIEISKLEENLDKRVAQDKITEAEKENILNTAKEFKQTMAKVPEDVDQESKRKIYQLINEKMNIQKKAAGKDEAIQNKANERVEGINEQIANIYEAQTKKQAAPVSPAEGATEAAPTTEVSPESEVETRFFAPAIEKDSKGSAIVDPGKVREETFTGASVISKGHVDEDTALNINSALSLLGEKAKDMKVRVFDSVESLLNADQRAADFYVKNNKMPKAYIKGNEMFVLTKNAVEQYNKAKGTNVEYAKQYIHEVGHPIVSTLVAEDPEAQDRLYSEIEAAAAEGDVVAQRALAFGKNYASQGEGKVKNESLVEFMALVTDQKRFKSLNRTTKQKIKDFFNSLLSSISSEVVIKTDAELYDVARSMRDAFRMQKAINIQPTTNKQYQQRSTQFSVDEGTTVGNRLFNEPLPDALSIAEKYAENKGIDYDPGKAFNTLDTEMSQEIAAAYDAMEHNPKDPEVNKAYEVMVKETAEQYDAIIAEGYVVEINNNEPYSSSKDMIEDLASNKRMKIFSTESGFGSEEITDDQRADNPLLRDSGYTDVNGEKLLMNDVFRFVHDFFGHAKRGNGFGPKGEENAWDVHSRMYTPLARRAMTSETRGQNSWVNFSGVNEEAFKLRDKARKLRKEGRTDEASKLIEQVYEIMSFAEQKIGLMPEKYTANPYIEGGDPDFSLDEQLANELPAPSVGQFSDAAAILELASFGNSRDLFSKDLSVAEFGKKLDKINPREFTYADRIASVAWYRYKHSEFESRVAEVNQKLIDGPVKKYGILPIHKSFFKIDGDFNPEKFGLKIVPVQPGGIEVRPGLLVTPALDVNMDFKKLEAYRDWKAQSEVKPSEIPGELKNALAQAQTSINKIKNNYKDNKGLPLRLASLREGVYPKPAEGGQPSVSYDPDSPYLYHFTSARLLQKVFSDSDKAIKPYGKQKASSWTSLPFFNDPKYGSLKTNNQQEQIRFSESNVRITIKTDSRNDLIPATMADGAFKGEYEARITGNVTAADIDTISVIGPVRESELKFINKFAAENNINVASYGDFGFDPVADDVQVSYSLDEEFYVSDEVNADVESKGTPRLDDISFSLDEKVKRHEGRGKIVRSKLKDFVGKVMHVTFSDRMVGGFVGKEEYLGGVYFPFITNSVWGANSIGAANKIIKAAVKNADGYRYVVIAMMNPDSHMSNLNMSTKALKELENELNSSRVTVEEGYNRIMKAFDKKALKEKFGETVEKYKGKRQTKSNLIKLIDETVLSSEATFDLRRSFLETVLGKADKNLKLRFGKLPSYSTLAQLLAEPVTRGMNAGDTSFVIRTKGDLSVAEPKKGDPDYHPSYKNIVRSTGDVELVFLDGIYNVVDMFPRIEAKNLGHKEYQDKYGDNWRMRYLMYMGLGKMSTTVSDEMAEAQAKAAIDFSTDEGINWYESPEGKGDPAISRRDDMLQEAAQDLKAGRLKNYEFREMAKALSPIEPITRFFAPATTERMAEALDKNKLSSLNKDVKDGEIVALRLDIPAYTKKNTWVVSIHDGKKNDGKIISYRSVGRITDVVFKSKPLSALSIAGGEAKSTIGRMFGKYKSFDGKTPEDQAETAKNLVSKVWKDGSYKQIGMNPTRASYFYDRGSGRPVVSAEEVIQIGGLVYAKNPVYARWNDPAFEVKGYNDVDGAPIYFSADEGEGNVNNLRRTVSRTIGRFKDSRERILSNPDAYYTKQSLKSIKENLELMTEDELLENMTAEGLNRVANEAGPGKGENDISVLAAVELINRKAEAGEDVSELLVDLAKVGTTVGRMLRHFAELKSATPLGIVATIEGALAKANRIMSATQVEKLTDIAERFIKAGQVVKDLRDELESGYSKETEAKLTNASKDLDKVTRELNKFTSLIVPKKTMNLLSTTIQGNLLTPISQITNVGANLFQIATSIPVRGFETLFSKITGKFSGGTKRSFKYSLMAIPFALKRGGIGVAEAIETIIKGGASTDKIIHTGFLPGAAFLAALSDTKFASMVNKTLGKEAIKGDVLPQMANGKINPADRLKALYEGVFGIAPEIMFRFLALGDKPFSRFAEGMETYQQAARLGLKGDALKNYIKYPNKKQQKAIEEAGRKLTFQQDSKIATGFFGATNWLEKQGPIGSAVAFALKLTMPYVKTPANIFTETLKFAVPGIGMASAIRNFQKKNFDEGASDLAKAATGQMLVIAANALIANGLVSGAFGEEDEEERSLKYLKFPPMSINKSGLARLMKGENPDYRDGDVFMRYDKFGIVGMVIGARVTSIKNNLVEAKGEAEGYYVGKKDKGFFEPFNRVFDELGVGLGTVQFLNSQSFLTGANGLLSVLSGEASEYDVEKWFENTFRSVTAIPLPNTLSSIHRSIREYMPNLRTNSVENKFRYILMDRLFNTDGVPIKIDMLGNKIPQTPEGANKWIYNLMDFTKTQESRDQFILNEVYRLYELQEQADLIPGFPTKIQKIPTRHPETGAKITGWDAQKEEEYRRGLQEIQEVYGKKRADILERLFRSDSYQTLTNERKQERVIETLQDYDRGYTMIKALPGSGMKNLKPPMEWAKMLNELNDKYFD